MKKLFSSLPAKLLIGIVVGIIVVAIDRLYNTIINGVCFCLNVIIR